MQQKLVPLGVARLTYAELDELAVRNLNDLGNLPPTKEVVLNVYQLYLDRLSANQILFHKAQLQHQADSKTKDIITADSIRDLTFKTINKFINATRDSDITAEREASYQLKLLTKRYKNLTRLSYDAETSQMDLLVTDLEGPVFGQHIATLQLQRHVARMSEANAAFKAIVAERSNNISLKEVYDTKLLQQSVINDYNTLCRFVETMANVPDNGYYVQLLAHINTIRKNFSDLLARRAGVAESKAAKETLAGSN